MRLFLHAGIHRTGTTSLQRLLARNRDLLRDQSIAYPGEEANHQPLAWALHRHQIGAAAVLDLVEAARAEGADQVVLSGEDFAIQTDLGWLREVAARIDTQAIFYLRRQDHWLMSWYNQHVKWPFDRRKSRMDPAAFLATLEDYHWLDYERLLGRWSAALGQDQVGVAVLEKGQVEDATADVFARIGIDPTGFDHDPEDRANDSLPVHVLEIARHLGLHELKGGRRMRILNALRTGLADKAPVPRVFTVYSPAERNRILTRFEVPNRTVARNFFGRETLFLEPLPAPDAPYWRFPETDRDALFGEWITPVVHALIGVTKE